MTTPSVRACYSADYPVRTRHRNLEKLGWVAEGVQRGGLARLIDPGILDVEWLYGLHDARYVDAFLTGERPLATSQNLPWSPELRSAILAMQAGQLTGARLALADGVAGHVANGFHHARHERGRGFCTFNGLALVAYAHPRLRVFVLDCDDHGGDGTATFTHRLPNLYNYSICSMPFGCAEGPRSVVDTRTRCDIPGDDIGAALDEAIEAIERWQPDLLVYQAGVDSHEDDPMGDGRAGTSDLYGRDRRVFSYCQGHGLPVLFTLSGGYQPLEETTELHLNTFRAAESVYQHRRKPLPA